MVLEAGAVVFIPMLTIPEGEFMQTILHQLVARADLSEVDVNDVMMLVLSKMANETGMITERVNKNIFNQIKAEDDKRKTEYNASV